MGGLPPHHQGVGAVVDVGVYAEVSVLDGAVQGGAARLRGDTGGGEELGQGDVVPAAHDPVQLPLQLPGTVHADAQPQRPAAADHLGDGGEDLPQVKEGQGVRQADDPRQQEQPAEEGAEQGQGLVVLLGPALLLAGLVVGAGCAAGDGAEVGGILGLNPLLFLCVPVDGPEDEQQDAQPGGQAEQDEQGYERDTGKIVFLGGHDVSFTASAGAVRGRLSRTIR